MPAYTPEQCDELLIAAMNRGDVDAAVALYEPTASLVLDSGEIVTGHAAIREAAQSYLALKPTITIEVIKAIHNGDGDLALTTTTWSVTGTDADGTPFTGSGKSAEVVRRQPDGTWLFAVDNPHGGE